MDAGQLLWPSCRAQATSGTHCTPLSHWPRSPRALGKLHRGAELWPLGGASITWQRGQGQGPQRGRDSKVGPLSGRGQRPVLADPPGQSHSWPPDPHGTPRKALDSYGASFGPDVPCWGRRPRELGRMLEELERGGGAGPSTVSAGPTGSGSPAAPPPRCVNRTRGYSVTGHAPAGGLLPVCLLNTDCC